MSEDFEREPIAGEEKGFDPAKVSPSRVNKLSECGVAFKMKYLDGIPEQRMGSHALFGNVVHAALEKWALDRSQDLLTLMRQAWVTKTEGTAVKDFLAEYGLINVAVMKAEVAAREAFDANPLNQRQGKVCKAPRMTKHFKESAAARDLNELLHDWMPKLEETSPWEFTERDPLPQFYDDSLVLAKRYQKQWGHLQPVLHTEFAFDVPWRGFRLIGYIDVVELLLSPEGELQGIGVEDYKTYRRQPAEHKDYRQLVMYDVALRYLVEAGVIQLPVSLDTTPIKVGIDYVRQAGTTCDWKDEDGNLLLVDGNSRRFWQMTEADYDVLERDLQNYKGIVQGGFFQPAPKSAKPEFCDYGGLCCLVNVGTRGGCAERTVVRQ